ncbi:MAG: hypothetical protein ABIP55_10160 [Tepidisphaeraceae bacterium]
MRDHLDAYKVIDVALDTFPYNGTTTTCEALWMGAAVLSRVGQTHVARVGLSLLTTVGLAEFATETDEAFVAVAVGLASDRARLTDLRRGLRERVAKSRLTDASGFTTRFEGVLRQAWHTHCGA